MKRNAYTLLYIYRYNRMNTYTPKPLYQSVDWFTILLYAIMVVAGWFSICGASYDFGTGTLFAADSRPLTQLQWIGISLVVIFVVMMLEEELFEMFAYPLYVAVIGLLVLTIFIAPDIKGSHSWLVLGPIRLQPAELAKFSTALAVARLMNTYGFRLTDPRQFTKVLALIFLPMICILMQRETGSALVYLAFFLMLYREGMSGYVLLAGVSAVVFFVVGMKYAGVMAGETPMGQFLVAIMVLVISQILIYIEKKDVRTVKWMAIGSAVAFGIAYVVSLFVAVNFAWIGFGLIGAMVIVLVVMSVRQWVWNYALIAFFAVASLGFLYSVDYVFNNILEPHQQIRIKVSLGLEDDPSGAGYNVNQSKIAIGSGGFLGKGFLNGTQTKLKYVPEQETDFIFCTVGEEQGFVGATAVLVLFAAFIIRLFALAERQDNAFGRVYGYSVASIFLFHLVINIGMVTGLTPVIGIPLPFFSYGGSSLLGFTLLLFIFLRIDASRRER